MTNIIWRKNCAPVAGSEGSGPYDHLAAQVVRREQRAGLVRVSVHMCIYYVQRCARVNMGVCLGKKYKCIFRVLLDFLLKSLR